MTQASGSGEGDQFRWGSLRHGKDISRGHAWCRNADIFGKGAIDFVAHGDKIAAQVLGTRLAQITMAAGEGRADGDLLACLELAVAARLNHFARKLVTDDGRDSGCLPSCVRAGCGCRCRRQLRLSP